MPSSARPQPLRLLLDTNVVVAGLLWNGPPRRLIEWAIEGEAVELLCSPVLLDELAHTLGYSKFASRIAGLGTSVEALVAQYTMLVSLVMPASVPRVVAGDANDDHVIAAAVAARAELIVTGDHKHLLPIGTHQGIAIAPRVRSSIGLMQNSRPDPDAVERYADGGADFADVALVFAADRQGAYNVLTVDR